MGTENRFKDLLWSNSISLLFAVPLNTAINLWVFNQSLPSAVVLGLVTAILGCLIYDFGYSIYKDVKRKG